MGIFGKKATTNKEYNSEEDVSIVSAINQEDKEKLDKTDTFEFNKFSEGENQRKIITDTEDDINDLNVTDITDNTEHAEDLYIDEVIEYFTQTDPIKLNMLERGKLDKNLFIDDVKKYIKRITPNDSKLREKVFKGFSSFIWSYDILDELIEGTDSHKGWISDIKVYDWGRIRIKEDGKRKGVDLKFRNEKHYLKFIEHVAIKNKVSISDQNAAQNFVDKESSEVAILRFNITTGFINSSGKPVLHIRKIPKHKPTEEDLIKAGFFDKKTADYLKKRAVEGGGFLFSGRGGSGKTTAMNWLIDLIPHDRSGLVIQENEELFSDHPDIAFEHTVENRGEGKIEYNLGDLARNGLLTDIDYFIIGEIKGAEALYLLNAVYTGAKGWASVHGASAEEAMKKLVDYIKYNSDYTQEAALEMLIHLDTVVFMENYSVKEIVEVEGYDPVRKNLIYKRVL